jgi:hypothetical protein
MIPRPAPLLSLLLAACAGGPPPSPSQHFSSEPFEDLPAPRSATYRDADSQSFAMRSRSFRCGRFLYDYPGPDADAVRFFKETMTQVPFGWTFAGEQRAGEGSTRLEFRKRGDRCLIDVDRVPFRQTVTLDIRVNLDA